MSRMRLHRVLPMVASLAIGAVFAQQPQAPPTPAPAPVPAPSGVQAPAAVPNPALDEARAAIKAQDYPKALEAAQRALQVEPESVVANYIAGIATLRLGRLDEAETFLETCLKLNPKTAGLQFQLGFLDYSVAEGLSKGGDVAGAKTRYKSAAEHFAVELERSPTQIASLSSRAIALGKAGDLEESIKAHEAWITAEPASNNPLLSLGSTLAKAGRADEAAALLDRLPVKDAEAVKSAALTWGALLYEQDDAAKALPLLAKALAADPGNTRAQGLIVGTYAKMVDMDHTASELRKFLEMNPPESEAEQVGELIKDRFTSAADASAPRAVRLPAPRYPKLATSKIKTDVAVLVHVHADAKPTDLLVVPNRIWKENREMGFEEAAFDAVRRGKYEPGLGPDGKPADRWLFVTVPFVP